MKNPAVVPFKCLDTFALEGVARTFGSGAAGVRLTHDRLEAHVRPSRRRRQSEAVQIDALIAAELGDGASGPRRVAGGAAILEVAQLPPCINLPRAPEARRSSMPSLVAMEAVGTSLRRPTTWAVLLLTLGISFGVVLARAASSAASIAPVGPASVPVSPTRALAFGSSPSSAGRVVAAPAEASPSGPVTLATTRIVGRRHRHHDAQGESATPAEAQATASSSDTAEAPAPPPVTRSTQAEAKPDPTAPEPAPDPASEDDETTAAAAAAERVHRELSDSL